MARLLRISLFLCGLVCAASLSRGQLGPLGSTEAVRARVVVVKDAEAVSAYAAQPDVVKTMFNAGLLKLSGKSDLAAAWRSYVSTQDTVGIKLYSAPGPNSGTRPAVVAAAVEGLLAAGLAPEKIIIWDKRLVDLRLAGFDAVARKYGVRLEGASDEGYDADVFYDNTVPGTLVAGDLEFDEKGAKTGRKSFVTKLLTKQVTKIVIISPLLNHNAAGLCGNIFSLALGSVDNTRRFEIDRSLLANAVPEIFALPALSDHVCLCITDALIGQYEGEELSLLHYSTEVKQLWLSKDPVALDALGVQELDRERQAANTHAFGQNPDLLANASLLELGTSDLSKVRIDVVKPASAQ